MVRFVQGKWTYFVGPSSHSVTSLSTVTKDIFVNEMVLKKQKKVIAEAVPTIQPETKLTIAERAGRSGQQNVSSSVFGQKATDKQNCS